MFAPFFKLKQGKEGGSIGFSNFLGCEWKFGKLLQIMNFLFLKVLRAISVFFSLFGWSVAKGSHLGDSPMNVRLSLSHQGLDKPLVYISPWTCLSGLKRRLCER